MIRFSKFSINQILSNLRASFLAKTLLFALIIFEVIIGNWLMVGLAFCSFVISLIPNLIEKRWAVALPWYFDFTLVFILYFNLIGNLLQWYNKIYGFDKFAHFFLSALFAFLAFMIIVNLYYFKKIRTSPSFAGLLIFSFSLTIGCLWEIVEFLSDLFIGTNAQKSLVDTMFDLIYDGIGATFIAVIGWLYIRNKNIKKFSEKFLIKTKIKNKKEKEK